MADRVLLALNMRNVETILNMLKKNTTQMSFSPSKSDRVKMQQCKMLFKPDQSPQEQLNAFQNLLYNNEWNGHIVFSGFKGFFKLEYWTKWQEILRNAVTLQKISFVKTKLERKHLVLLRALINWLKPNELSLKFKHNELDDEDLDDFLINELLKTWGRQIKQFSCISNPGIFKGHFISRLRRKLQQMSITDAEFEFKLYLDENAKSVAFLRIPRQHIPEDLDAQIAKLEGSLGNTHYFKLNFQKCFNLENEDSFQHLIQSAYLQDQLEMIESLDVGYCRLGILPVFENMCKKLSGSKGLLSLGFNSQLSIQDSQALEALMGTRYGRLRLNHIDIGNNSVIVERCLKVLADGLIGNSLKTIDVEGSMNQHLPVLVKLIYIIDAFQAEISRLRTLKGFNFIPKLNLRKLNLSSVDNYNRHDLTEQFLKAIVFNEFSGSRELVIQNVDVGRAKAYIKAVQDFKSHIAHMQQHQPQLYNDFKPKLESVHLPKQSYRMETEVQKLLLETLFFTKTTDLLQIKEISFTECCRQQAREDGIKEFIQELEQVYLQHPDVQYTLKSLKLINTSSTAQSIFDPIFKNILFSRHFQLETLHFTQEDLEDQITNMCIQAEGYFQHIPQGQFWSLKSLMIYDIQDGAIDVFYLVRVLVFTEKARLEELILEKFTLANDIDESRLALVQVSSQWKNNLSLQKLTIGSFEGGNLIKETTLVDILVISPYSCVQELFLRKMAITESISIEKLRLGQFQHEGKHPMKGLKKLSIAKLGEGLEVQHWEDIFDMLVFAKDTLLQSLEFNQITITHALVAGLVNSHKRRRELLKNSIDVNFHLTELRFIQCTFEGDILLPLMTSHNCKIEKLRFEECKKFGELLEQLKDHFDMEAELLNYLTSHLEELVLDKTEVPNVEYFNWFLSRLVFSKNQRMKTLSMVDCKLTNAHILSLRDVVAEVQQRQQHDGLKNYFVLRNLNFKENNLISAEAWRSLFECLFRSQSKPKLQFDEQEIEMQEKQDELRVKQQLINDHCLTNMQIVKEGRLGIRDKLDQYPTQSPTQLRNVTLDLSYAEETEETKGNLYQRLIGGLIFFPQSQVNKVTLNSVDIDLVVQCLNQVKPQQLKKLELSTGTINDPDNLTRLIELITKNSSFQIEDLKLRNIARNFYPALASSIQQSLSDPSFALGSLKVLHLDKVNGPMKDEEFTDFCKYVLLNGRIPLEEVELNLTDPVESEADIFDKLVAHVDAQGPLPLSKLVFKFKHDPKTVLTLERVFPLMISGVWLKLDHLSISSGTNDILNLLEGWGYEEKMKNFTIKSLVLDFGVAMLIHDFRFIYYANLKKLELPRVDTSFSHMEEITNFLAQNQLPKWQNACESFTIDTFGENQKAIGLLKDLVLNPLFGFSQLVVKSISCFQLISVLDHPNLYHIRKLTLSFGLLFNSQVQIQPAALSVLGQHLIYNEQANLEELCLHQCHLKHAGIAALTSHADEFRKSAKPDTYLKLKRLSIYYSLYIGDDGAKLLSENIFFFEFITIERFEMQVTNWNDQMCKDFCTAGTRWLDYQRTNNRKSNKFEIWYADWGRNEFVQSKEAWDLLCDTFIFSDDTPKMEVLNLHFMGIKDEQVGYICEKAKAYLLWKGQNYSYPVKRLNFMLNTALSPKGWYRICEEFFFADHVNLEEINFMSTMLDSPEKLQAVYKPLLKRAMRQPNGKVTLHSLLTYNISLKQQYHQVMSPRPKEFQPLQDQPVAIEQCQSLGIVDGIPESIGAQYCVIQRALYSAEDFINVKWRNQFTTRFGEYHLDITDGFLRPFNRLLEYNPDMSNSLVLNLASCDELATMFSYNRVEGTPFPYCMLFTNQAIAFYASAECRIRSIHVIANDYKNSENVTQFHVLRLWELVRDTGIQAIYFNYSFNDDLVEHMFEQGYTELDVVSLIRMFPPTHLRLQDVLTLQALKGIYSIMWDNYKFTYAYIMFNRDIFLNVGVGYALREYTYRSQQVRFKKQLYSAFDLFVSPVSKYTFSDQTKQLNKHLEEQGSYFTLMFNLTVLFYVVCTISPYLLQHFVAGDEDFGQICHDGLSEYASYTYLLVAALSWLVESLLFWKVVDHMENLGPRKTISTYWNHILVGQIAKLDYFNDICFILSAYYCEMGTLAQVAFVITAYNVCIYAWELYRFKRMRQRDRQRMHLSTKQINDFYQVCVIGRNIALADLLDSVSPYNVTIIPNCWLTRRLVPSLAGRSISNSIKAYFLKFAIEDVPQIILQMIFLVNIAFRENSSGLTWSLYLTFVNSAFTLFVSFNKFMSLRPSYISQEDFDALAASHSTVLPDKQLQLLDLEQTLLQRI